MARYSEAMSGEVSRHRVSLKLRVHFYHEQSEITGRQIIVKHTPTVYTWRIVDSVPIAGDAVRDVYMPPWAKALRTILPKFSALGQRRLPRCFANMASTFFSK